MTDSPTTPEAAAEEISVRLFGPGDEPMTRIIQGILAKHYAALTEQLAAVTAERDENIMSCEITYDEWKRMQKRAEAAEAESGLLTRSLERAMNWKDAAEAELAELEGSMTPDEAFEAWFASSFGRDAYFEGKKSAIRSGWLACSQHYQQEIEAVAAGVEKQPGKSTGVEIANLLRTRLLKGGGA